MKPPYDLLPKPALDLIAQALAFGSSEKYEPHDWRPGKSWSDSYAAAMRHLTSHQDGETFDQESGLPHLAHAGARLMFLLTWLAEQGEGGEFDDRYQAARSAKQGTRAIGGIGVGTGANQGELGRDSEGDVVARDEVDWADFMCPNCLTPWKCNGPHILGDA